MFCALSHLTRSSVDMNVDSVVKMSFAFLFGRVLLFDLL